MKKILPLFLALLTACGGGSDSNNSTSTTAAGRYSGRVEKQTSNCPFETAEKLKVADFVTLDSTGTIATITIADGTQYTATVTPAGFQYHFDRTSSLGGYGTCEIVNTLTYSNIQIKEADVTLDSSYACENVSCVATWFGILSKNG